MARGPKIKSAGDAVNQVVANKGLERLRSRVCESGLRIEYQLRSGVADHKLVPVAVGKHSLTERKRVKFEKLYTVKGVECNERSRGEVVWR